MGGRRRGGLRRSRRRGRVIERLHFFLLDFDLAWGCRLISEIKMNSTMSFLKEVRPYMNSGSSQVMLTPKPKPFYKHVLWHKSSVNG